MRKTGAAFLQACFLRDLNSEGLNNTVLILLWRGGRNFIHAPGDATGKGYVII